MTLKKFIKHFDDMIELRIIEFPNGAIYNGNILFKGYTFDKGAKKKLKKLYKQDYILERNDDGCSVMIYPYVNEHGAVVAYAQVNVKKSKKLKSNLSITRCKGN